MPDRMNGPTRGNKLQKLLSIEALTAQAAILLLAFSITAAELSTRHIHVLTVGTAIFVVLYLIFVAFYHSYHNTEMEPRTMDTAETAEEVLADMGYYAKRHDDLDFWVAMPIALSSLVLLYGLAAAFIFGETTGVLEQLTRMFPFVAQ